MYEQKTDKILLQGDVIFDFIFVFYPAEKDILTVDDSSSIIALSNRGDSFRNNTEIIVTKAFKSIAMIISQSCDIDHREFVYLAPVINIKKKESELLNAGWESGRINNLFNDIRSQKVNYYLYLPEYVENELIVEESFLDLQFMNAVTKDILANQNITLTLTDKGRHWLSHKIANFFGRPFAD